jgi:starch phosphorylase
MERFSSSAPLPSRIHRLHELALDVWWSWRPVARQVFRRLDYDLWRATSHNPVRMLRTIDQARLAAAAQDPDFLALYDESMARLD